MTRLKWLAWAGGVVALVGVGALVTWLLIRGHQAAFGIPQAILKQPGFQVFSYDPEDSAWKIQGSQSSYDPKIGVLTLHFGSGTNSIILTQQTTPDTINDIPNYYAAFLGKLQQYAELHTTIGTVALTKPVELKGGQSAVANIRGTLMFAHPAQDLSNDEWQQFFNNLKAVR